MWPGGGRTSTGGNRVKVVLSLGREAIRVYGGRDMGEDFINGEHFVWMYESSHVEMDGCVLNIYVVMI